MDYKFSMIVQTTGFVASNIKSTDNNVEISDSLYASACARTRTQITNIFGPLPDREPQLKIMKTQKQVGANDWFICHSYSLSWAILGYCYRYDMLLIYHDMTIYHDIY